MEIYKQCQFYDDKKCGLYQSFSKELSLLCELNEPVKLKGVKKIYTESELITNRCTFLNMIVDPNKLICPKHRYSFGIYWFHGNSCQYPEHSGTRKPRDPISWKSFSKIIEKYPDFPILGGLCQECLKSINFNESEVLPDIFVQPGSSESELAVLNATTSSQSDVTLIPSVASLLSSTTSLGSTTSGSLFEVPKRLLIDEDVKRSKWDNLKQLCSLVGIEPPRYQLIKSIEEEDKNMWLFKKIFNQLHTAVTDLYCDATAPGQETDMKEFLMKKTNQDLDEKEMNELQLYLKHYEACTTSAAQQAILSLIPAKFSKETISNLFGINYYRITVARRRNKMYGPLTEPQKQQVTRQRLDMESIKHFLGFLTESSLLQEEAYGTTVIKYDSGDKRTISNSLLMCVRESAIKEYRAHCESINRACFGSTTLRKILNSIKPKTRRRLAGLDTFLVHGYEAFEVINFLLYR